MKVSVSILSNKDKSLKNTFPNLKFVDGKRFTGNESQEEYRIWIK